VLINHGLTSRDESATTNKMILSQRQRTNNRSDARQQNHITEHIQK